MKQRLKVFSRGEVKVEIARCVNLCGWHLITIAVDFLTGPTWPNKTNVITWASVYIFPILISRNPVNVRNNCRHGNRNVVLWCFQRAPTGLLTTGLLQFPSISNNWYELIMVHPVEFWYTLEQRHAWCSKRMCHCLTSPQFFNYVMSLSNTKSKLKKKLYVYSWSLTLLVPKVFLSRLTSCFYTRM